MMIPTVIVFFISFLFFQKYNKRNIAVIGMAFMLSVFVTYVMIGLGLFGWLHAMKGFHIVTSAVNIAVALLAIVLAVRYLGGLKAKGGKKAAKTSGKLTEGAVGERPAAEAKPKKPKEAKKEAG